MSSPHHDVYAMSMAQTWHQWHHHGTQYGAGKERFYCKTQYMSSPPQHDLCVMSPMTPRWHSCHLCHSHWINDTLSWSWERAILAQYGTICNICPPHLTMTYMLCHPWHRDDTHVTYVTNMASMTPSWQQWHHAVLELGKGDSVVKQWHNMAQYVIYVLPTSPWRICYVTHDTTMTLMSPMSQTLNQWHTVLELGKGYFGVEQWHNMAQYVIYVLPTSPWRICYVTHDTTMALMSPMSQTWNQWHHHGNNDTTLSWSWERAILL